MKRYVPSAGHINSLVDGLKPPPTLVRTTSHSILLLAGTVLADDGKTLKAIVPSPGNPNIILLEL